MRGLTRPRTHRLPRAVVAAIVSAVALAGVAQSAGAKGNPTPPLTPPALLAQAEATPDATFMVIVRGRPGDSSAAIRAAFQQAAAVHGHVGHQFTSIAGVSGTLTGADLTRLARNPHVLSIVPDAPVLSAGVDGPVAARAGAGHAGARDRRRRQRCRSEQDAGLRHPPRRKRRPLV